MKIILHPDYHHLENFIRGIPFGRYEAGMVYRNERNILQETEYEGVRMVIKKFKRPTLFNCIVYTFFRKSKARRSFEYALRLLHLGIATAPPIAYIEVKRHGFFHTAYYISQYLPYSLLNKVYSFKESERRRLLADFAVFTARMHMFGVLHRDYNLTNVFFFKELHGYRFALIDINRMSFKRPRARQCISSLKTMGFTVTDLAYFADHYAKIRGWNPELLCGALFFKRGLDIKKRVKNGLKFLARFFKRCWRKLELLFKPHENILQFPSNPDIPPK